MRMARRVGVISLVMAILVGGSAFWVGVRHGDAMLAVEIVERFPHDENAYTQGLIFRDGILYESTGQFGESTLRAVDLQTGTVQKSVKLSEDQFGEGLAFCENRLYQLTWKNGQALVYDPSSLRLLGTLTYPGEGWGLASNGRELWMSDGSSTLRVVDPSTFHTLRSVKVIHKGQPVPRLNELEFVEGKLLANVWQTDHLVRIDPASGQVEAKIDLRGLLPERSAARKDRNGQPAGDVLNGIAYDAERKRLFVTGKNWPTLFQIRIVEK